MYKPYEHYLRNLHTSNKYRSLGYPRQGAIDDFLDFSSNDYLNLSNNSNVISQSISVGQHYGTGATGSRLLSGNFDIYEQFEATIAEDKNSPASLIFNSGFQANISTLSSLLNKQILGQTPLVFFDKLNHSSLYQAVFLSQAELYRYHHNDMNHLEWILEKHKTTPRPKFIVTETIFGMDGDQAYLPQITALALKYNAFMYLDEAHATGVFGIQGYGLSTLIDLQHIPYVVMGTFSKAIGASGGYVACHSIIRDFLINTAPGFIYSTALSPLVVGCAFKAWTLIKDLETERQFLQDLGKTLRQMLKDKGFNTGTSQTHIVPIILNEEELCLKVKDLLNRQKIRVSCIRPPTVPPGSARLRIALTTRHQRSDLERLVQTLEEVLK